MATDTVPEGRLRAWWEARVGRHLDISISPDEQEHDLELGRDLAAGRVAVLRFVAPEAADTLASVRGAITSVEAGAFTFEPATDRMLPDLDTVAALIYIGGRTSVLVPTVIRERGEGSVGCEMPDVVLRADRRNFERVRRVVTVAITDQHGTVVEGRTVNLSGGGLSVAVPSNWSPTPLVAVRFVVGDAVFSGSAVVIGVDSSNAERKVMRLHLDDFAEGSADRLDAALTS